MWDADQSHAGKRRLFFFVVDFLFKGFEISGVFVGFFFGVSGAKFVDGSVGGGEGEVGLVDG